MRIKLRITLMLLFAIMQSAYSQTAKQAIVTEDDNYASILVEKKQLEGNRLTLSVEVLWKNEDLKPVRNKKSCIVLAKQNISISPEVDFRFFDTDSSDFVTIQSKKEIVIDLISPSKGKYTIMPKFLYSATEELSKTDQNRSEFIYSQPGELNVPFEITETKTSLQKQEIAAAEIVTHKKQSDDEKKDKSITKELTKQKTEPILKIVSVALSEGESIISSEKREISIVIENTGNENASKAKIEILELTKSADIEYSKVIENESFAQGEKKNLTIPLVAKNSLGDGKLRFSFRLTAKNLSKPITHSWELITQQALAPSYAWTLPLQQSVLVSNKTYSFECCVTSKLPLTDHTAYLNEQPLEDGRGFKAVSNQDCDYVIKKTVTLKEGANTLVVKAKNAIGETISEKRTINYISPKSKEKRLALIIGNSDYNQAPLKNPVNDAKAIAEVLKLFGFEVMIQTNSDKKAMRQIIRDFGEKLNSQKGIGLFYYAGHGMQVKGENYLIPLGSDIQREFDVPDEAVRSNLVLNYMENSGSTANIIILDACRDNPFAKSSRSASSRGLGKMNSLAGTFIAYATAPGEVASDGTGDNGLFTQEFIEEIKANPNLDIELLFRNVRRRVLKKSDKKQLPWSSSSLLKGFKFEE